MKAKYTEKQLKELYFIKDWSNEISTFYIELGDEDEANFLFEVDENYQKGYIEGFREGFNDINLEAIEELTGEQIAELNRRLKNKFGKTLWDVSKKIRNKIENINKKHKIKNNEEYYLVKSYLDTISDLPEYEELQNSLEKLIYKYEQTVA